MKGRSIPPYISFPPSAVGIEDKQAESAAGMATEKLDWVLEDSDPERSFVGSLFSFEPQTYRLSVIIKPKEMPKGDSVNPESLASPTSRPSTPVKDANGQMLAYGRGTNGKRDHARVHSQTSRPPSTTRSRLLSLPSSALRPHVGNPTWGGEGNFLIGEVIVDPASFPHSYEVRLGSELLPSNPSHRDLGCEYPASGSPAESTRDFPMSCKIDQIPPSPLSSNSISSLHRLRIFVVGEPHVVMSIEDPLKDQGSELPQKPDWLLSLERHGALINISIRPSDATLKDEVMVDGTPAPIILEEGSSVLLNRSEGTTTCPLPILARYAHSVNLVLYR